MDKKIIVCVVGVRGFPKVQGGAEKHCESLYPLMTNDFEFIVYRRSPYVNSGKSYLNIRFVDLPSTKIKGFEALFHSFIATVGSCFTSASIVHFHNIGPGLFAPLARLFGKKVVLTYHSANYEHAKWGTFAKKLLHLCESVSLHFANGIIFVNRFQMEKYPMKIRQKSVHIPNGVPDILPTKADSYIKSLGLETHKYILGVGRITPEKGFDILIKAYKKLDTDYKLVIVGGVETESEYFKQLKGMDHADKIIFTGYVYGEELNELYSHAALYVLSSRNEGFPLVLLEAMKYDLDVLVSDIPACRLVKLNDSDYFPVDDVPALSEKLSHKLKNPLPRKYDLSAFDWKLIARQVENVYFKLVNGKHPI